MVKLLPKFMPRHLSGLLTLKLRKERSWVALHSVPACQVIPAIVIKAEHTNGIYHSHKGGVGMVYVTRWDEKAGLRRDAVRSQVIDAL